MGDQLAADFVVRCWMLDSDDESKTRRSLGGAGWQVRRLKKSVLAVVRHTSMGVQSKLAD